MSIRVFVSIVFPALLAADPACAHGDLHDRIAVITEQLGESPTAARYFKRGCLYFEHGEAGPALADFDEAERLAPGMFATDIHRAECCMLLGRDRAALVALNRCIDRNPTASRCLVLRARVFLRLGDATSGIADYQKALSLTPRPEPDLILDASAALAKDKQNARSLEILDQGIARLGPLPSLVGAAVEIELASGNIGGALRRIDVARDAAPRPEPWMAQRASILARAGRIEESRAAWQALLSHISALPSAERSSHAMSSRAREARDALAALKPNPQ